MTKGQDTRKRILDVAQDSVLAKGFGATSIDEIIAATGITKSGFFYHFKDKNELAKAMLQRYLAEDEKVYDDVFSRARSLVLSAWLEAAFGGLLRYAERPSWLPCRHQLPCRTQLRSRDSSDQQASRFAVASSFPRHAHRNRRDVPAARDGRCRTAGRHGVNGL